MQDEMNAIELLKSDHREVESLFADFEEPSSDKIGLGRTICTELMIHTEIEEELFYPAAKEALGGDDADLVSEANVEHGSLKQLIADLDGSGPDDELFEARFKVLKEYVQHHVKEEERELMPAVERTSVDLDALGRELAKRKEELKQTLGKKNASAGSSRKLRLPKMPGGPSRSGRRTSRKSGARRAKSASSRTQTRPARKSASKGASSRRSPRKAAAGKSATSRGQRARSSRR
jgi:hypothetical protein